MHGEVPHIDQGQLPDEERPHATVLWHQLHNLASSVSSFEAALRLYDTCLKRQAEMRAEMDEWMKIPHGPGRRARQLEIMKRDRDDPDPSVGWMNIAGRDGALTLWHFMRALAAIKANLDRAPTLRASVRVGEIDGALREFRRKLPDVRDVRDAVAHTAELTKNPDALARNATKPFKTKAYSSESGGGMWTNNFEERTFMTTADGGEMVRYDLSGDTLRFLVDLTRRVYAAFPARSSAARPPA